VPLVSMKTMMRQAMAGGYAVGYFEAWGSYSLEAALEAAEEQRSPVILGFGAMMLDGVWLDHRGVELLGAIGRTITLRARVPFALLFNEAQTLDQAQRAIDAGFNAVMLDTSAWPRQRAVDTLSALVREAHSRHVTVEVELGRLPDATATGIDMRGHALTDPADAVWFMAETGADCLAVSIGNVHLLTTHSAPVDLDRLAAIRRAVPAPLVIHGGTSFPPECVAAAISHGVAKFNVGTVLKRAFREAAAGAIGGPDVHAVLGSHKPADCMVAGKAAMKQKISELMRLYGSAGRADDLA